MTAVLIMAGGKSARMRASGDSRHKALRTVGGLSLIERNLRHALASGFRDIFVAASAGEPSIQEFVQTRGRPLVKTAHGSIKCLLEHEPLGTIGIAHRLADLPCDLLVLNVDNISTLNLSDLVRHHQDSQAAMTIAVHEEGFKVPLGEVITDQGQIVEYREKPTHPVTISSGAYVLAARTRRWIEPNCRTDIPELIPMLRSRIETVTAFQHTSAWIDINDDETLQRAEELVVKHDREFSDVFFDRSLT